MRSTIIKKLAVERQAGQPAPFAIGALPGQAAHVLQRLMDSARGLLNTQQPQAAAATHEFDEDDEYLQDILAQFPAPARDGDDDEN